MSPAIRTTSVKPFGPDASVPYIVRQPGQKPPTTNTHLN